MSNEKLRLDKYLWAIRIFKTRTQAANAIAEGKVKSNGAGLKSSKQVSVADRYDIKANERIWQIEVTGLIDKRVAFTEAIKYYIDHTPPEELDKARQPFFIENTGKRQSKQGRPTKKNRRNLGRWID